MDQIEGQDIFFHNFMQEFEDSADGKLSEIQNFYENATVFITGATGLLGQILIEKLLRSTKVKKIFVLIRPKDGKTPQQRLNTILNSVLFTAILRDLQPVEVITGDCCLPNLGLSENDRKILIREVDIVFHAAATTASEKNVKENISVNIGGTKWLLKLAKEMRHIQAFLFISTAFAEKFCARVEERVLYSGKLNYDRILTLVDILEENHLKLLENSLWEKYPSPFIFTKHVAEGLIRDFGCEFPIGIFRPTMLVSSAFEPLAGWLNDVKGVQEITHLALSGLLRVFYARKHCKADIVPVDLAANCILAFAWNIGNDWIDGPNLENVEMVVKTDPVVLNYSQARINPITWDYFMQKCIKHGLAIPKLADYAFPAIFIGEKVYWFKWILHFLPALIFDVFLYFTGQQVIWKNFYTKIDEILKHFEKFTNNHGSYQDKIVCQLWDKLGNADRTFFNFDLSSIDWNEFIKIYVRGIRIYHVKEDMTTLPSAKSRMAWLKFRFYSGIIILLTLTVLFIKFLLNFIRYIVKK